MPEPWFDCDTLCYGPQDVQDEELKPQIELPSPACDDKTAVYGSIAAPRMVHTGSEVWHAHQMGESDCAEEPPAASVPNPPAALGQLTTADL